MPGSSLWLVPPENSELYKAIHNLIIDQVPSIYPATSPPHFAPHVTLTSAVSIPDSETPEQGLNSIQLPESIKDLDVGIRQVEVGSIFVKKITMRCDKQLELCELAASCRMAGVQGVDAQSAQRWVEEEYSPHCSLMYSDLPTDEVEAKIEEVKTKVREAKEQHPDKVVWAVKGGSMWLVPTYRPIEEWRPVAIRELPEMRWSWHQ